MRDVVSPSRASPSPPEANFQSYRADRSSLSMTTEKSTSIPSPTVSGPEIRTPGGVCLLRRDSRYSLYSPIIRRRSGYRRDRSGPPPSSGLRAAGSFHRPVPADDLLHGGGRLPEGLFRLPEVFPVLFEDDPDRFGRAGGLPHQDEKGAPPLPNSIRAPWTFSHSSQSAITASWASRPLPVLSRRSRRSPVPHLSHAVSFRSFPGQRPSAFPARR